MSTTDFAIPYRTLILTLTSDHHAGDGKLTVDDPSKLVIPAGRWTRLTAFLDVQDGPAAILKISGVSGNDLAVTGPVDGYADVDLPAGTVVVTGEVSGTFADLQAAVNALESGSVTLLLPGGGSIVTDEVPGAWTHRTIINLPADVPSSLASSTGDTLIGIASSDYYYFSDAKAGDIAYRAAQGHRLIFGVSNANGTSRSSFQVSADSVAFTAPIRPAHLADSAAPNDSIYVSTTTNKLTYKDQIGVLSQLL